MNIFFNYPEGRVSAHYLPQTLASVGEVEIEH